MPTKPGQLCSYGWCTLHCLEQNRFWMGRVLVPYGSFITIVLGTKVLPALTWIAVANSNDMHGCLERVRIADSAVTVVLPGYPRSMVLRTLDTPSAPQLQSSAPSKNRPFVYIPNARRTQVPMRSSVGQF